MGASVAGWPGKVLGMGKADCLGKQGCLGAVAVCGPCCVTESLPLEIGARRWVMLYRWGGLRTIHFLPLKGGQDIKGGAAAMGACRSPRFFKGRMKNTGAAAENPAPITDYRSLITKSPSRTGRGG